MSDEYVPQGEAVGDGVEPNPDQESSERQLDVDSPVEGGTDDAAPTAPDASAQALSDELKVTKMALGERTEDLQRLQAEYVNYKRRVDRDRALARQGGIEAVAEDLLPVLDAIDAARQHDELTGGFKLVADELERVAKKYGLEAYGDSGEVFDPHHHEAFMAAPSRPGQTDPEIAQVLQRGYRLKDRVIRHARVSVSEPDPNAAKPAADDQ